MNKARISVLGLSLLLSTVLGNHHFGHHGEQAEHRAIQSRSSKPWPGNFAFLKISFHMGAYLLNVDDDYKCIGR